MSKLRIRLWRGYHAPDTMDVVRRAWEEGELLVLCPPALADFGFLESFPRADYRFSGEWSRGEPPLPRRHADVPFPEQPVYGLFTTGTTRERPKLVLYSRRNVEASLDGILSFFDTSRLGTVFCYPQPAHTFGLCLGYLLSYLRGLALVTGEGKYATSFHEKRAAVRDPSTLTLGTPTHLRDLIAYVEARGLKLAPTYSAILGGAAVPRSLWREVRDKLAIEAPSVGYGATEACPGVTHLPPGREPVEDGEIGVALPHLTLEIGEGELTARGSSVCLATLSEGKWDFPDRLTLADDVRRRDDGVLVFRGRAGRLLNRGGEKFALDQIEGHLRALGAEAVAVALPDARLGQELGIVARTASSAPPVATLYESLHAAFGRRFDPSRFIAVEALPLDDSGKPDRRAAAALFPGMPARVPVSELASLVPHRPPAVWIREVARADEEGGECIVALEAVGAKGARGVRATSLLEWMAQGYAYTRAARARGAPEAAVDKAYLAGVRDFTLAPELDQALARLGPGDEVVVRVRRVRELGPLSLVAGEVVGPDGARLASAELKLFALGAAT